MKDINAKKAKTFVDKNPSSFIVKQLASTPTCRSQMKTTQRTGDIKKGDSIEFVFFFGGYRSSVLHLYTWLPLKLNCCLRKGKTDLKKKKKKNM